VVLSADGEFDPSFNRVGFTRERVGAWSSGYGLAIHSTGEIVTAGGYGPDTQTAELVMWRHLPDGSPDTTFGGTGVVYPLSSGVFFVNSNTLALDNQERIILLTIGAGEYFVYRFNRLDGSPDLSFSPTGRVSIRTGAAIYAVVGLAVQPDNKIVGVGGAINPATARWEFFVFRLQEDGELDPTFAGTGRVWTPITPGGGNDRATGVALQPDGKIVVAGRAKPLDPDAGYNFALARYTADGELDDSFGTGGKVVFPVLDDNLGRKVVIQPDGKIVIAGYTCEERPDGSEYCYFGVARVDSAGVLDPSFAGTGIVHTDVNDGFPYDVALQPDNKIVALGIHGNFVDVRVSVVLIRYLPDGSLDSTFGDNGISETNYGYIRSAAGDIRLQPDGQIVVSGGTSSETQASAVVARYQANGAGQVFMIPPQSTDRLGLPAR
jgi:uncharacterized delta-60 repeat protein